MNLKDMKALAESTKEHPDRFPLYDSRVILRMLTAIDEAQELVKVMRGTYLEFRVAEQGMILAHALREIEENA